MVFTLLHHERGPREAGAAAAASPVAGHEQVADALALLAERFADADQEAPSIRVSPEVAACRGPRTTATAVSPSSHLPNLDEAVGGRGSPFKSCPRYSKGPPTRAFCLPTVTKARSASGRQLDAERAQHALVAATARIAEQERLDSAVVAHRRRLARVVDGQSSAEDVEL
jgi:hypothetical protein